MQHERRLAGAVGAEQRDALAVLDVQVDAAAARRGRSGSGSAARGRGWRSSRRAPIDRSGSDDQRHRGDERDVRAAEAQRHELRHVPR